MNIRTNIDQLRSENDAVSETTIPSYAELLTGSHGGPAGTSWGIWGPDDEKGAMNLLTEERTAKAAALVKRGTRFGLTLDLTEPSPPMFGRAPFEHTLTHLPNSTDDRLDGFYPQASSQWDGLCHVAHPDLGFYNGVPKEQITGGRGSRLGVDNWAREGIAARFVVLDIAGFYERRGAPLDYTSSKAFGADVLDAVCADQGVEVTPGTILLLHTGWFDWYRQLHAATKTQLSTLVPTLDVSEDLHSMPTCPGLARDESVAAWLWDHGVPAVAADNPGLEALPFSRASVEGWLHYRLLPMLGIAIGELWKLDELTADCRVDGVWEGLIVAAPLNIPGGVGSPTNAVAIK